MTMGSKKTSRGPVETSLSFSREVRFVTTQLPLQHSWQPAWPTTDVCCDLAGELHFPCRSDALDVRPQFSQTAAQEASADAGTVAVDARSRVERPAQRLSIQLSSQQTVCNNGGFAQLARTTLSAAKVPHHAEPTFFSTALPPDVPTCALISFLLFMLPIRCDAFQRSLTLPISHKAGSLVCSAFAGL
jgi:hypothetical protein